MDTLNHISIFFLLICLLGKSIGYKWITINEGDSISSNAVRINDREYVGRARHYDEILVATVNSTVAVVTSCGNTIAKHHYDVLVSRDPCRWETFTQIEKIPEFIVHAGTASNGEPIYVGRSKRINNNAYSIESIYLLSKSKNEFPSTNVAALICNDNSNWIDTEAAKIPNNTVEGGVSTFGKKQYVARLKNGCSIIPGNVIPEAGFASAVFRGEDIFSPYCQVLVGEKNEYKWQLTSNGLIPDYAVVSSKDKNGELMYVARMNKTIGYLTQTGASNLNTSYDILVKNQEFVDY